MILCYPCVHPVDRTNLCAHVQKHKNSVKVWTKLFHTHTHTHTMIWKYSLIVQFNFLLGEWRWLILLYNLFLSSSNDRIFISGVDFLFILYNNFCHFSFLDRTHLDRMNYFASLVKKSNETNHFANAFFFLFLFL